MPTVIDEGLAALMLVDMAMNAMAKFGVALSEAEHFILELRNQGKKLSVESVKEIAQKRLAKEEERKAAFEKLIATMEEGT